MDDLLQDFIAETSDSMAALDNDLVDLERHPDDAALIGRIFRLVHTVKGNCGFLGLPRIENVAHHAENVLGQYRSGALKATPDSVSLVLQSLDRIKEILSGLAATGREPAGDDAALVRLLGMAAVENPGGGAVAESTPPPARDKPAPETSLRVGVETLENIMATVSDLVLTRNLLLSHPAGAGTKEPLQRLDRAVSQLQEDVMKARLQPVGLLWDRMPRLLRDVAIDLGLKVRLEQEGAQTGLDRQVLELLRDPLTHLVRNAAAHGIEKPAERAAMGKPPEGVIKLAARQQGGQVVMTVSDDGRGLDVQAILEKAAARGLADEAALKSMTPEQAWRLILAPGFSTAREVSPAAGRGVGMDVVRENVEKAGGTLDISSVPGRGTVFTLRVPLALSIARALLAQVEDVRVAVLQSTVREVVMLKRDGPHRIERKDGARFLRLRDALLPLVSLHAHFGFDAQAAKSLRPFVIVFEGRGGAFGIIVDRVLAAEEIVIRPVHSVLRGQRLFAGNALLGDGGVVMVLDPFAASAGA